MVYRMDDTKSALGLGSISTTVSSIINDVQRLATVIESTLLPKIQAVAREFGAIHTNLSGQVLLGPKGQPISPNQVAAKPLSASTGEGAPKDNVVADSPLRRALQAYGGGGGIGGAAQAAFGASAPLQFGTLALSSITRGLPNTSTAVEQDYLTQRARFYGLGSVPATSGNIRSLQKSMARIGTATDAMDTTRAINAAQNYGLAGFSNFNQVMQGVAQASNLEPGMGQEAIARAFGGTLNAPTTINLARTIGINIRQPDGSMLPFGQLVDRIWSFINQNSGGRGMDKKSIQISLMPGNGIYNFLNGLFNGDPGMVKMVADALLAKASFSGQSFGTITKEQQVQAGIQSATVRNIASRTAAQTNVLTSTSAAISGGYAGAADVGTGMNNLAAAMSNLTAVLGGANSFIQGVGGIGGGALGSFARGTAQIAGGQLLASRLLGGGAAAAGGGAAAKAGGGLLSKLFSREALLSIGRAVASAGEFAAIAALADGGSTDSNTPYIVGERGPELFVPKTDGVVVPNHLLGSPFRQGGGPVKGQGDIKSGKDIVNFLMQQGFSSAGAEGIAANLNWESGLNTKITGDKGTSFGLAQWHAGRWDALRKFATDNKLDVNSATTQLMFLTKELNQKQYAGLKQSLMSTNNSAQATFDFMKQFERPKDQSAAAAAKRLSAFNPKADVSSIASGGTNSSTGATTTSSSANTQDLERFRAATAGSGGNNYNYGGITINVTATDPKAVGDQINKVLAGKGLLAQAGGK